MDSHLIRFRVDSELHERATKVCADIGVDLTEVLRATITRIARDGELPFPLGLEVRESFPSQVPFQNYGGRLWGALKPQIDAEVAIALLARFIADCSTRIDEAGTTDKKAPEVIEQLTAERTEARRLKRELNVADAEAVARVLETYGALLRDRSK